MPEKRFKTVLEIGGSVESSLKNSFNIVTGNTKKLGATIKGMETRAKGLRKELSSGMGGSVAQLELARLETQIKRTKMATDGLARIKAVNFGGRLNKIGSSITRGATAVTLAAGGIGAAFIAMTKSVGDYADNAFESAAALGMQTNALIKMKYAAADAGVSGEELQGSIAKVQYSLEKARSGSGDNVYKLLKLDIYKLSRMKPEEQIKTISEAFKNYKGKISKAAIAMQIFGKSGAKMVNFLELGREGLKEYAEEAEALGLTINENLVENGDHFARQQLRLGAAFTGVKNIIGTALLPVFNKFSDQLIDFVKGNAGEIKQWAEEFGKYLENHVPIWVEEGKKFSAQIADFGAKAWKVIKPLGGVKIVLGTLVALPFLPAIGGIASLGGAMFMCARGLAGLAGMPTTLGIAMKLGGAIKGLAVAAIGFLPTAIGLFKTLGVAIWGCSRAVMGFMVSIGPVGWALLAVGAAAGVVYWKWDLISKKVTEFCGPILESAKTSLGQFGKYIYDWASSAKKNVFSFSTAIGTSITKTFNDLKIKIDSWFNWIGGKFQWIGDSVKKVGGWFGGTNFPSPGGQVLAGARALGGPVSAGKRYLVGERGPEIFQPRTSGQIIPNGATNNRTINNHITIHAAPGMNEQTLADLVIARLSRQQAALAGGALYD